MCCGDEQYVIDGIREYARDTIGGLKERFPDNSGDVLQAFDMFHLGHFQVICNRGKIAEKCRELRI